HLQCFRPGDQDGAGMGFGEAGKRACGDKGRDDQRTITPPLERPAADTIVPEWPEANLAESGWQAPFSAGKLITQLADRVSTILGDRSDRVRHDQERLREASQFGVPRLVALGSLQPQN